jgi:hypothetical protein
MKSWVVLVVFALGCGSKDSSPEAKASARPSVDDPIGFCTRARGVLLRRKQCFSEDTSIKMALEELMKLEATAPQDKVARRKVAAKCAVQLDGLMRVEQPRECPLDATDSERAELTAFLDAWYGERTAAPTTGNVAADAALQELVIKRDAACACATTACAREIATSLEGYALASDAPKEASDAASQMIEEVGRCKQKLAFAPPK